MRPTAVIAFKWYLRSNAGTNHLAQKKFKIPFREECRFDSERPHHPCFWTCWWAPVSLPKGERSRINELLGVHGPRSTVQNDNRAALS